jgi:predicted RNase H-like HicB family nuclease
MKPSRRLTAIIEREDDGVVALCPDLDIASEGASIEQARTKLIEARTLFFETAAPSEVARRFHSEVFVTLTPIPARREWTVWTAKTLARP